MTLQVDPGTFCPKKIGVYSIIHPSPQSCLSKPQAAFIVHMFNAKLSGNGKSKSVLGENLKNNNGCKHYLFSIYALVK